MTKYATMIENPMDIRYACEKAWHLATTGRPGPVWIDVPVDIQGTVIETDDLKGYDPAMMMHFFLLRWQKVKSNLFWMK